jgi:hypothetical protein
MQLQNNLKKPYWSERKRYRPPQKETPVPCKNKLAELLKKDLTIEDTAKKLRTEPYR